MDDDLSMDSFVDIVANTVGIVIILTMLTIARVDERNLDVDTDLKAKVELLGRQQEDMSQIAGSIMGASRGLVASGSDLGLKAMDLEDLDGETALERATSLLKRMDDIRKDSERIELQLVDATNRGKAIKSRHDKIDQDLTSLRARKKSLTTAMRVRKKVEALLVTDLPGLNMGKFERTPLTSMKQEVRQLESRITSMEAEAKIGREEFNRLQKDVAALRKEKAVVDEDLARYREVTGLEIAIASPPPLSEQLRMPVFFECFSRASATGGPDELCVRFVGPGAAPDGEHYRSITDAASAFRTFVAGQTDEFRASRRLHFIVRPDAGAAFRKARQVARDSGWTVGWNPIEKGAELEIGAVPAETITADTGVRSAAAPR